MTLEVVQAAYRLDLDDDGWLRGVVEAIRPHLDVGLGVGGAIFDASDRERLLISNKVVMGTSPLVASTFGTMLKMLDAAEVDRTVRGPEWFCTTSDVSGPGERFLDHRLAKLLAHPLGVKDLVVFKASRPNHQGVFVAGVLKRLQSITPVEAEKWAYAAAHVAAAHRLRVRLSDATLTEAVVTPSGNVVHAEEPAKPRLAREALRQAVLHMEHARAAHADSQRALETWTALVEGRWSLVDHFDTDGRRFVVVRRNDPRVPDPRRLTLRERQVVAYVALGRSNKMVAYEMGLSQSTVADHLRSALRKLGLKTRAELVRVLQATPAG